MSLAYRTGQTFLSADSVVRLARRCLGLPLLAAVALLLCSSRQSYATIFFWDINGATAGAGGTSPSGTWSSGTLDWSTSSTGTLATGAVTTGTTDDLTFSAGTDATGSYAVTVSGTQQARSITFEDGLVTLSGGTAINLNVNGGAPVLSVTSTVAGTETISTALTVGTAAGAESFLFSDTGSASLSIGALSASQSGTKTIALAGSGTTTLGGAVSNGSGTVALVLNSSGTLNLNGTNTFTGGTTLTAGTLKLGSTTALGGSAGTFTIGGGTLDSNVANLVLANSNPVTINGDFTFAGTNLLNLGTGTVSLGTAAGTTRQITNNGASPLRLSGIISDGTTANSLTKAGSGALILTAANSYSGVTTVSGGTLQLGDSVAANGSVAGNIVDNATVTFANPSLQTYAGTISGSGAVTKAAAGTLTLTAANSYAGGTTITAGTLQLGDGATLNGSIAGNITDNATLAFANPSAQTYSGIISGSGTLTKSGAGTLVLTGVNTYGSGTTINTGTLQLGDGATLNGSVIGNIVNNSTLVFANPNFQGFVGVISGPGAFTKTGAGQLSLNAVSTFSGPLTVNGGSIVVQGVGGGLSGIGDLSVGASGVAGQSGTFTVDGQTSVTQLGAAGGTLGATSTTSGTLKLAQNNFGSVFNTGTGLFTINRTSSLTIGLSPNGGTFNANGDFTLIGSLTLNAGAFNLAAGKTMTIQGGGSAFFPGYSTAANAIYNITGSASNLLTGTNTTGLNVINGAQMNISAGGFIDVSRGVFVGTSGNGTVTIDGTATNLTSNGSGGGLFVGSNGSTGSVTFQNNARGTLIGLQIARSNTAGTSGTVLVQSGADVTASSSVSIADLGGAMTTGALTIDGAGSTLQQTGGNLTVATSQTGGGGVPTGSLSITNGGAYTANSSGSITVNGGGTITINGGSLTVPVAGTANVTINGSNGDGAANITLSGSGAMSQSTTGSLTIGGLNNGTGTLTVNSGATYAAATGGISVNGTGTLLVNGGTFNALVGSNVPVGINSSGAAGSASVANITVVGLTGVFNEGSNNTLTVGNFVVGTGTLNIGTSANGGAFSTGTGQILVQPTGVINVGSGANAGAFNANGNVTITGGHLNVGASGSFNLATGKTMTIQGGGIATFTNSNYTTTGSLYTITGAGSAMNTVLTTFIHNGSAVNVQAGGKLAPQRGVGIGDDGTTGTLTVDGSASQLLGLGAFASAIGGAGGSGSLTLSTGAQGTLGFTQLATGSSPNTVGSVSVQSGADFTMDFLSLLSGSGASGSSSTFTVTGAGSTATQTGTNGLQIGTLTSPGPANATLTVSAGGVFTTGVGGPTNIDTRGLLDINGGTFNANGDIFISGGTLQRQSAAGSALNWASGHTLSIQDGGGFITAANFNAPGTAVVNVTGAGSTMIMNGSLLLLSNGAQLNVTAGGSASAAAFTIGNGTNGTVVVDGAGSMLVQTTTNNGTVLGTNGGSGSLTLHNNASATLLASTTIASTATAGTTGALTVDSGADLVATDLTLGLAGAPTTSSLLTVSGVGSTVAMSGSLTVGNSNSGPATVNVNDGGTLTVGLGQQTTLNPSGTINLNGGTADLKSLTYAGGAINLNSGSLSILGNLTVGVGGPLGQNLTLDAPKNLTLSGTTTIDQFHALTLSGGSLTTGDLVDNGTLNFSSGTLRITGAGGLTIGSGSFLGSNFTLPAGATLNVANQTTVSAGALLDINGGTLSTGSLSNSGLLSLDAGTLVVQGAANNNAGGLLYLAPNKVATINGAATNAGEIQLGGATALLTGSGTLANNGLIRGDGVVANSITNNAAGEIRAESGKRIKLSGINGANAGKINLQSGTAEFSQPLTNSGSGLIAGRGTLFTGGAGLNNLGNVALSSGISDVFGDVVNNTGSGSKGITISGSAAVTFWDDVTNTSGLFKVSAGSSATFFGTFGGGGISGSGQVNFEADVTPGFSPAAVTFGGNLTFDSTSTLHIDIGGTTPGSAPNNHDQVNVVGAASLGGTLDLVPFNGFVPVLGDKFVVMTYASATGMFAAVTGTTPAPGLTYTPVYSPTNLTILTIATGGKSWAHDASGNSSLGANWTGGIAPGGVGDSATFSTIITAPRTVNLDADTTVGTLKFDSPISYTLAGPQVLTLQATGSNAATINIVNIHGNGAHTISAPLTLASDLNIVQSSSGTLRLTGTLDDSASHTINKSGSGTVEIAASPTLGANTVINASAGTLRFAAISGSPTIGTGVSVAVNGFGTLELAGSVSALAAAATRADVANNSSATAGVLVSGTNQIIGGIEGSGTTQVNTGGELTANHIVQTALVIGGADGLPAMLTIAASDDAGNPLGQAANSMTAPLASVPPASLTTSFDRTSANTGPEVAPTFILPSGEEQVGLDMPLGSTVAVPEPGALVLAATGLLAGLVVAVRRRKSSAD